MSEYMILIYDNEAALASATPEEWEATAKAHDRFGHQVVEQVNPRRVHVGHGGQVQAQAPVPAAPDRAGVAGGTHPGPDDLAFKLDRQPPPLLGKPGDPEHASRLLVTLS